MKTREMLKKIESEGNPEKMHELHEIVEDLFCDLKEKDHKEYEEYKMCLYEIAYGKKIDKDLAEKWVNDMVPRAYWSYEDAVSLKNQYGLNNISAEDFYILINMGYSDYGNILGDPNENVDKYAMFAKDFIEDKDAKEGKLYCYYKYIVKKD